MNLMEESFQNKEVKKSKAAKIIVLVLIVLVVMAIIGIGAYLAYLKDAELKIQLDGQVNNALKEEIRIEEDGTVYFKIKEVARYFGYESYNGEYKQATEDKTKCYIINNDINEIANFSLASNKIYKLDLSNTDNNYEYIYTKKPVKSVDGVLYATSEAIEKAFNVSFVYDDEKNRMYIYTLPYLIKSYTSYALDQDYTNISEKLNNQKAIFENMLVVEKGEDNKKIAVIDLDGNTILEPKYDEITYLPNIGDFLVKDGNKVGITSKDGKTKLKPEYDSIELMDVDAKLYVVKKGDKYGAINFNGDKKIFVEYDEIGMDISNFEENNIKNKYILAGNLIPVRKDEKWGLFDKNGKQVVDFEYDGFGYVASTNKDAKNLLVIPNYEVLVAKKDEKYTLLNSLGKQLFIGPVADSIYMTISSEKREYWIDANDVRRDAEAFLKQQGELPRDSSEEQTTNNTNTNTQENKTNNENQETQENQEQNTENNNEEQIQNNGEESQENMQQ